MVKIFRVTRYRMLTWLYAVISLMSLVEEHFWDRAVFPSAFPCGNTEMSLFSCRLLSPRVLQVNV